MDLMRPIPAPDIHFASIAAGIQVNSTCQFLLRWCQKPEVLLSGKMERRTRSEHLHTLAGARRWSICTEFASADHSWGQHAIIMRISRRARPSWAGRKPTVHEVVHGVVGVLPLKPLAPGRRAPQLQVGHSWMRWKQGAAPRSGGAGSREPPSTPGSKDWACAPRGTS